MSALLRSLRDELSLRTFPTRHRARRLWARCRRCESCNRLRLTRYSPEHGAWFCPHCWLRADRRIVTSEHARATQGGNVTSRGTAVRWWVVPVALLRDEPARRAWLTEALESQRRHPVHAGVRLRLRLRRPTQLELQTLVRVWHVPYIAARESRVIVEVIAS